MVGAKLAGGMAATGDTAARALKNNEEIHTIDTDGGIVLDAKIDVLLDTKAKVSSSREVLGVQLVLLNLQAALQDLLGLRATDSAVDGNLFVTTDGEGTNGVAGLGVDGRLASKVLQNLGSTSKTIAGLTNGDVQAELGDLNVPHGVGLRGRGGLKEMSIRMDNTSSSSTITTRKFLLDPGSKYPAFIFN